MDPRLLRTFSAVITHGSFSYAARESGDTQSAVSQQTASPEEEMGIELVCRRPVGPTQAGARWSTWPRSSCGSTPHPRRSRK
ncbi:LysR family transcriptional regulator [Streptomyces microflavus]|uniref:LysR family transcriptional regulator n=1 Tax=Streptomyces microflavus TaxID=1919 RepID=UPI00381BDBCE